MTSANIASRLEPQLTLKEYPNGSGLKWPIVAWTQIELVEDHDRYEALRALLFIACAAVTWGPLYFILNWPPLVVAVAWLVASVYAYSLIFSPILHEQDPHDHSSLRVKKTKIPARVECSVDARSGKDLFLVVRQTSPSRTWDTSRQRTYRIPLQDVETFEKTTSNALLQGHEQGRCVENNLILAHIRNGESYRLAKDGGGAFRIDPLFHLLSETFIARRPELYHQLRALQRQSSRPSIERLNSSPETL